VCCHLEGEGKVEQDMIAYGKYPSCIHWRLQIFQEVASSGLPVEVVAL